MERNLLNRYPELKEIIYTLRHEIQNAQRPANEIILAQRNAQKILKLSKQKISTFNR